MALVRSASRRLHPAISSRTPVLASLLDGRFAPLQSKSRHFHLSSQQDSAVILGGLTVAAGALGLRYGVEAYQAYKNRPKEGEQTPEGEAPKVSAWAKNFYDGPFEDKMSRREAALILGVRESASKERIRAAHRRLVILNHPDTGGSTYLSTKINEAKDKLLGGSDR